jgi:co-chaperonin GroES (HSP10)
MKKLKPLNGYVFIKLIEPKSQGVIVSAPRWKHESSLGVVTCVGDDVDAVSVGDTIQISPNSFREINIDWNTTLLCVHISDILAIITEGS